MTNSSRATAEGANLDTNERLSKLEKAVEKLLEFSLKAAPILESAATGLSHASETLENIQKTHAASFRLLLSVELDTLKHVESLYISVSLLDNQTESHMFDMYEILKAVKQQINFLAAAVKDAERMGGNENAE